MVIPTVLQGFCIYLTVTDVLFIVAIKEAGHAGSSNSGIYLLILAVVAAGFYRILSRRLSLHYSLIEIMYVMMWYGTFTNELLSYAVS